MFRYLSDRVLEVAHSHSAEKASEKSICELTEDKRLVVCGFLGHEVEKVKIPNTSKALQKVRVQELKEWLHKTHGEKVHLMVWNMSGETYDYTDLDDQVVELNLGMHPAPPMDVLIRLVDDVVMWLRDEKEENPVAVLHDLSGRRSAVVAACVLYALSERDEGEKPTLQDLLKTLEDRMGGPGQALVPSQIRYIEYYMKRRERAKQFNVHMNLQRVIVNGIPDFVNTGDDPGHMAPISCKPFLKVIQGMNVVAGTLPKETYTPNDLCFSLVPISPFPGKQKPTQEPQQGCDLKGDVLARVYHHNDKNGSSPPMFAVAFHTAFVDDGVLRVEAEEIDGARRNGRFPKSFFVDLIFAASELTNTKDDAQAGQQDAMVSQHKKRFTAHQSSEDDQDEENDDEVDHLNEEENDNDNLTDGEIIDSVDHDDLDLTAELERYTSDMESMSGLIGLEKEVQLNDDLDDEEEFDIDAFASSLNLDS